jgi:hypothetical protein
VATTTAAASGAFSVAFADAVPPDGIAYVIARGPADPAGPTATLAIALPAGAPTSAITVNERTTVAMSSAMAQFVTADGVAGLAPGVRNSAAMTTNLVDPVTGALSAVLTTSPNGDETSTLAAFDS